MKATYKFIGDPNDGGSGPGSIDLFGFHFPMNVPVEVETDDKNVLTKLEGNGHFEKVDGRTKAGRPKKAAEAVADEADE